MSEAFYRPSWQTLDNLEAPWSDHGTNFVGTSRQIKELIEFLQQQKTNETISNFCSGQNIEWVFIPERAPHFGGLREAAVKSFKTHLARVAANVKLTFEELATVLIQIEACLNSRPLASIPCGEDGMDALTPGHFPPLRHFQTPPSHNRNSLSCIAGTCVKLWYDTFGRGGPLLLYKGLLNGIDHPRISPLEM